MLVCRGTCLCKNELFKTSSFCRFFFYYSSFFYIYISVSSSNHAVSEFVGVGVNQAPLHSTQGYADEMESNIRNILATEPDPVVLDVAKKMLDAVRITNPSKLYQPDLLSRRILYTIFSQAPDEITDFYLTEIAGLMKT